MTRIRLALAIILLTFAPVVRAQYHSDDPRLEKLFSTFISPCCWRENLTIHDSEIAHVLRSRIRTMVRDGRTDEEIKAVLVKEYTKQILALPEGDQRIWLFWTPFGVGAAGLIAVSLLLKRLLARSDAPMLIGMPAASLETDWEEN